MRYYDGTPARLGDMITAPTPKGYRRAKIVMLGDTFEHTNLEPNFVNWVKNGNLLAQGEVVIQWLGENPLAHSDPQYAPVGNTMFTPLDRFIVPEKQSNEHPSDHPQGFTC